MACIGKQKTASGIRRYIQLSPGENESRPKISLGKVTKKQAETAKRNIESLIQCKNTWDVLSLAVQEWLGGIADGLRKRLNILRIAAQDKGQSFTVAEWIGQYIERRPDVKQSTRKKWRDAEGKLAAFSEASI